MIVIATWGDRYISWVKVARLFKRGLEERGYRTKLLDGECEYRATKKDVVLFMPVDWFAWNFPYSFVRLAAGAGRTLGFVSMDSTDPGPVTVMAVRAIHRVLVTMRAAADVIARIIPPTRIDVVHLAIDYESIKEAPDLEELKDKDWARRVLATPRPRVLILAHHDIKRKNIDLVIKAMLKVLDENKNCSLVIKKWEVGGLPQEILMRDRVAVVHEFLRDEEMYSLYKSVDLVVMPSGGGACELPAIEAIAAGTPTIVSTWFSFMEYVPEAIKIPISRWEPVEAGDVSNAVNAGKIGRIDPDVLATLILNVLEDIEKMRQYYASFSDAVGRRWDYRRVVKEELAEVLERYALPFI